MAECDLLGGDTIDVSELTSRVDELREYEEELDECERQELDELTEVLDDLRGNGGDHQWNGDWYPSTLINDDYFEDYARQLAEDIGAIPDDTQWPCTCIDWEKAARELQVDYTSTEIDGGTYWYR